MAKTPPNKMVYFERLEIENVKAFAGKQDLRLTDKGGRLSSWTLILGDNGLGKTTLLRCLARMRPVLNRDQDETSYFVEPAIPQEDNAALLRLARAGHDGKVRLASRITIGRSFGETEPARQVFDLSFQFDHTAGEMSNVDFASKPANGFREPLVLGYGAGRHMGNGIIEDADPNPVASLFSIAAELLDAEEILNRMDHAALREQRRAGSSRPATKRLKKLKAMLASLLPRIDDPENIVIYGPRLPGTKQNRAGVYLKTPSGEVPFSEISLGYQTMTAWAVDLAWKLFAEYPDSPDPLSEPAIVLIDEIDLHLHPKWQRDIRKDLTDHFPNVQFIATAHSPLMAQTSLDANLAVLEEQSGRVKISNEPVVINDWRLDQVVTSELFGLATARPPEIEQMLTERLKLIRKRNLTKTDKARLQHLDQQVDGMSTAEKISDQRAMEIIRKAAASIEKDRVSK